MPEIETTIHFTSFNRPQKLKACIESFFKTCTYDVSKLEMIIVDNGSTKDEVKDYIAELKPPCAKYSYILNPKNDYPSCLRYSKIQARQKALGNYYIDCPDDHLFIVKSDWIQSAIEHVDRDATAGCVIHFAQPLYRYYKPNNEMSAHQQSDRYFRSHLKGYADYHLMRRQVYALLGEYQHELGRKAEGEYMDRALNAGYFRNLMKYPVAFINDDSYELLQSIDQNLYENAFKDQDIPVTNEQLIQVGIQAQAIRGI